MGDINKYKILDELGLVIQITKGDLLIKKMKKTKIEVLNDPKFNFNYVFLIDIRFSRISMTVEELKSYGDFISSQLALTTEMKIAILTNTPDQVAKTTLYLFNSNLDVVEHRIFSTIEHSLRWLNIDVSNADLIQSELDLLVA